MSATFPNYLRAWPGVITVGDAEMAGEQRVRFRVQLHPIWDAIRVDARKTDSVRTIKTYALSTALPNALFPDELSVKLGGAEILDETVSLSDAGVADGSTLFIAYRRRRPVR